MLLSAMVFCALRFETVATFTLSIQTPGPDRPSGRRRRIVSSPEATFTPLLASATSLDILNLMQLRKLGTGDDIAIFRKCARVLSIGFSAVGYRFESARRADMSLQS
ncbi:hypothetical protein HUJ05_003152 [Dendroctonus ponderosae]|nr:hypothetical protein HUJ05_003152 [Dendroctonus ponderosae]